MSFRNICFAALTNGDFAALEDHLVRQRPHESFEVLLDQEIALKVAEATGSKEIQTWITRRRTWDPESFEPNYEFTPADRLLSRLWQDLSLSLSRKMEVLRRNVDISSNSAVTCFPGGAKLSLLVSFSAVSRSGVGRLRPLSVERDPKAMLEIETLLKGTDTERKGELKKAIISVDKLTFYKKTIVHVNRQTEDVFGPTIDTVLLSNTLSDEIFGARNQNVSVLEVGPGSGLISVYAASMDEVDRICAIEINAPSAACTLKNMQINGLKPSSARKSISIRAERFSLDTISERFDYIVCNPPYIPEIDNGENLKSSGYGAAISGLELYWEIFQSLERLLTPRGKALFMTSSVSFDEVKTAVPDGYTLTIAAPETHRKVPLDLDLLWERPEWRASLNEKGLIELGDGGQMFHTLVPVWVYKA